MLNSAGYCDREPHGRGGDALKCYSRTLVRT